jgi:hypothetical protein
MNTDNLFNIKVNTMIQANCDWCDEHPKIMGEKFCSDECAHEFYSDFVAKIVDDDEDEEEEDVPLRDMNDAQIEKYVERIGQCPRDECAEWAMLYIGGDILRYSYCNFIQWGIEDQTVSNITITRAAFDEINFRNCTFDNVTFQECIFSDIILNNSTFKNCTFIECELDSSMVPDKSCKVTNNTEGEYDHYYARYDYEEDYDDEDDRQVYEDLY